MPDVAGRVADTFEARIREQEESTLSPLAVRSYETRGRAHEEEEECRLRTPFQRDRDRIVHCKAFRRLKHKTQVFIDPKGDHYRTRLMHTLETAGISRTVARAVGRKVFRVLDEPVEDAAHGPGRELALLPGLGAQVDALEHERPQVEHRAADLLALDDPVRLGGGLDDVVHERVDPA